MHTQDTHTHSLGSKIYFDTFNEMRAEIMADIEKSSDNVSESKKYKMALNAVDNTVDRTDAFFMYANQIPLLSLFSQQTKYDQKKSYRAMLNYAENFQYLNEQTKLHPFVAFTDPNDLFSYTLSRSEFSKKSGIDYLDVILSNPATILGVYADPYKAHRGYATNDKVQNIVACGFKQQGSC